MARKWHWRMLSSLSPEDRMMVAGTFCVGLDFLTSPGGEPARVLRQLHRRHQAEALSRAKIPVHRLGALRAVET